MVHEFDNLRKIYCILDFRSFQVLYLNIFPDFNFSFIIWFAFIDIQVL